VELDWQGLDSSQGRNNIRIGHLTRTLKQSHASTSQEERNCFEVMAKTWRVLSAALALHPLASQPTPQRVRPCTALAKSTEVAIFKPEKWLQLPWEFSESHGSLRRSHLTSSFLKNTALHCFLTRPRKHLKQTITSMLQPDYSSSPA
jgi:hypothetical protein